MRATGQQLLNARFYRICLVSSFCLTPFTPPPPTSSFSFLSLTLFCSSGECHALQKFHTDGGFSPDCVFVLPKKSSFLARRSHRHTLLSLQGDQVKESEGSVIMGTKYFTVIAYTAVIASFHHSLYFITYDNAPANICVNVTLCLLL